jgi:hypothetical protein
VPVLLAAPQLLEAHTLCATALGCCQGSGCAEQSSCKRERIAGVSRRLSIEAIVYQLQCPRQAAEELLQVAGPSTMVSDRSTRSKGSPDSQFVTVLQPARVGCVGSKGRAQSA